MQERRLHDLDYLCDTFGSLGVGVGEQLHDGRVHPHFARSCSHCAGSWPFSEAMIFSQRRKVIH